MHNAAARHGAADFAVAFGIFDFAKAGFFQQLGDLADNVEVKIKFYRP